MWRKQIAQRRDQPSSLAERLNRLTLKFSGTEILKEARV